jgi:Uma2 family endonuclease
MRAVMLEIPEEFLAERRQKGADRWDEMWDGVLHMVPPPTSEHQLFSTELIVALVSTVKALGLKIAGGMGVYRPGTGDRDYRQPDVVVCRPEHLSKRGVEGRAEFVVEVLSPWDESRQKLGFYAACGISEVMFVDPLTREFEHRVLREGAYLVALPDDRGAVRSPILGVTFTRVDGPKLRVSTPSSATEI